MSGHDPRIVIVGHAGRSSLLATAIDIMSRQTEGPGLVVAIEEPARDVDLDCVANVRYVRDITHPTSPLASYRTRRGRQPKRRK